MGQEVPRQRWTSGEPLVGTEERARERERESFMEDGKLRRSATDGLGIKCPEQPSLFRRPATTLIFECHQDDFHVSGSNVELAWLQENFGCNAQAEAC